MVTAEMRTRIMWENNLTKARQQGTIALDKARVAAANAEKAELTLNVPNNVVLLPYIRKTKLSRHKGVS